MLVRSRDDVKPVRYSDEAKGVEMRPLITHQEGAPTFSMRVFTLEPEGYTPFHTHDWEHVVYIIEGAGVVRGHSGEQALHVGDSVFVDRNESHQFRGGAAGLQFICCVPNR